jgi:hypothetical protein
MYTRVNHTLYRAFEGDIVSSPPNRIAVVRWMVTLHRSSLLVVHRVLREGERAVYRERVLPVWVDQIILLYDGVV